MLADLVTPLITSGSAVVVALIGGLFALAANRNRRNGDLVTLLADCMDTNRELRADLASYRRSLDTGTLPADKQEPA